MTQAAILAASGSPGTTTGFKNKIINGGMVIDQRNAGASYSAINSGYSLDRWGVNSFTSGATTGKFTVQQNAGSVTPPTGFVNYLGVTSSAATSSNAGDIYNIVQKVEGYNIGDLAWGTANAKSVTLSFWVRSSVTGTFGVCFGNVNMDYNYPTTYTISSANTWEYKTVTITPPTSGTWNTTNGNGIQLFFNLQIGSTYTGSPNSWQSSGPWGASGCVQLLNTNGATWYITGVQLEVGTTATNFDFRSYGTELQLCQRYLQVYPASATGWVMQYFSSAACYGAIRLKQTMRTAPSLTVNNVSGYAVYSNGTGRTASAIASDGITADTISIGVTASGATAGDAAAMNGNGSTSMFFSAEL